MKLFATLAAFGALAFAGLAYGYGGVGEVRAAVPANLHFLLRDSIVPLDEGKPGPSDHERVLYRGSLLDPKTKKPVGVELGFCIGTDSANEIRSVCQIIFTPNATKALSFADQITVQTIFDNVESPKPQRAAITGGTGRFAGVRGELISKDAPGGLIDVVFRFQR